MDPIWASVVEFWWVGPTVIGAGAAGWWSLRHQRAENARRLAYEAARHDVHEARQRTRRARAAVTVARAEVARVQAERATHRVGPAEVTAAREEHQRAQRELKAAMAAARSARARVAVARAEVPPASAPATAMPLAQVIAAHDAITSRWMEYETDPAKLIAFPSMSDGRIPATATFLSARATAQALRPTPGARPTPAQFAAYRDAVAQLTVSFTAAEKDAWRRARASGEIPRDAPGPDAADTPVWTIVAQQVLARSTETLTRAAEAAVGAFEARLNAPRPAQEDTDTTPPAATKTAAENRPSTRPSDTPPPWPVPGRSARPPRA